RVSRSPSPPSHTRSSLVSRPPVATPRTHRCSTNCQPGYSERLRRWPPPRQLGRTWPEYARKGSRCHRRFHRTYIGAIERGEKNLTIDSLERIAKTLKISAFEPFRKSTGGAKRRLLSGYA